MKDRKYYYALLPNGNSYEYPELEKEMLRRGVRLEKSSPDYGGRMWRLPAEDYDKLPSDKDHPGSSLDRYFGDDTSGHSLFNVKDQVAEDLRKEWKYGPWEPVCL